MWQRLLPQTSPSCLRWVCSYISNEERHRCAGCGPSTTVLLGQVKEVAVADVHKAGRLAAHLTRTAGGVAFQHDQG